MVCGVILATSSSKVLNVHEDVMSFIMGCDGRFRDSGEPLPRAPKVPIAHTNIDPKTGMEREKVSMVDIPHLKKSLQESVGDDQVVSHILAHVEENLKARNDLPTGPERCTNIKIDVPPQKVTGLSEQLQAVVQQNNYQLLEQVNTLFTFKLNSFFKEIEELLSTQTGKLGEGLVQLQQSQKQVSESLLNSSREQCVPSAGETRIFQPDSPPGVNLLIPENPEVIEKEEPTAPIPIPTIPLEAEPLVIEEGPLIEVEDSPLLSRPFPISSLLPISSQDKENIPVSDYIEIKDPAEGEETYILEDPIPIEENLPIERRVVPVDKEETHSVQDENPDVIPSELDPLGISDDPEEEQETSTGTSEGNVDDYENGSEPELDKEPPVESEPRRIGGFSRKRIRRPPTPLRRQRRPNLRERFQSRDPEKSESPQIPERPSRIGRPERVQRRPTRPKNTFAAEVEKERDEVVEEVEAEGEYLLEEAPSSTPAAPVKSRMELLMERRRQLLGNRGKTPNASG